MDTEFDAEPLADEIEEVLRRHVMKAWFPACVDSGQGGFHSTFDRQWNRLPAEMRILEFEARQTRAAARLALAYPQQPEWRDYALHGFRFLRDVMWDGEFGGWYWACSPGGQPLEAATKHMHSASYAVQACALVFRATGEPSALQLANDGFAWAMTHAWDEQFGGFFSWLTRGGMPILAADDIPQGARRTDPLGDPVGLKTLNVHGDWFEALNDLPSAERGADVLETLERLAHLYLSPQTNAEGETRNLFTRDWILVQAPEWFGYGFQGAHRLLAAAPAFPNLPLAARARKLTLHALRAGARRGGGYAFEGGGNGSPGLKRFGSARRAWWVQFEALRVLSHFAMQPGINQAAFQRRLERHWRFVCRELVDQRYGGIYGTALSDLVPWDRPRSPLGDRFLGKGTLWKDASHDTDSLLQAISTLRGGPVLS